MLAITNVTLLPDICRYVAEKTVNAAINELIMLTGCKFRMFTFRNS